MSAKSNGRPWDGTFGSKKRRSLLKLVKAFATGGGAGDFAGAMVGPAARWAQSGARPPDVYASVGFGRGRVLRRSGDETVQITAWDKDASVNDPVCRCTKGTLQDLIMNGGAWTTFCADLRRLVVRFERLP